MLWTKASTDTVDRLYMNTAFALGATSEYIVPGFRCLLEAVEERFAN